MILELTSQDLKIKKNDKDKNEKSDDKSNNSIPIIGEDH